MRGGELKMKKILFVLMALCFVSSLAFAADSEVTTVTTEPTTTAATTTQTATTVTTAVTTPESVVLKGVVSGSIDSGYSILADGKLYAFDKDSNAKVAEFLKKADSKLQVTVTAKQVGDELSLVSIENQN
jgi:ABC-type amino acid transport substrate-binding protein